MTNLTVRTFEFMIHFHFKMNIHEISRNNKKYEKKILYKKKKKYSKNKSSHSMTLFFSRKKNVKGNKKGHLFFSVFYSSLFSFNLNFSQKININIK